MPPVRSKKRSIGDSDLERSVPPFLPTSLLLQHKNQKVMTESMWDSFQAMAEALSCPLCGDVLHNPQTLSACSHSFCEACIDNYSCNNWQCPVAGCGQSIALRGNRKGRFRSLNPSLETLASSWKAIHDTLERATPEWWKDNIDGTGTVLQNEDGRDENEGPKDDEDEDDEWIDLQAYRH